MKCVGCSTLQGGSLHRRNVAAIIRRALVPLGTTSEHRRVCAKQRGVMRTLSSRMIRTSTPVPYQGDRS
jgi:hypothetical protein